MHHRRVVLGVCEHRLGLRLRGAADAPQLVSLGRVVSGPVLVVVGLHVLHRDSLCASDASAERREHRLRARAIEVEARWDASVDVPRARARSPESVGDDHLLDERPPDFGVGRAEGAQLERWHLGHPVLDLAHGDGALTDAHRDGCATRLVGVGMGAAEPEPKQHDEGDFLPHRARPELSTPWPALASDHTDVADYFGRPR